MTQATSTTDYQKQANDFLELTGTSFFATYLTTGKYFDDDKEDRDIYEIQLLRNGRSYKFKFGQSINKSGEYHLLDGRLKAKLGRSFASKQEIDRMKLSVFDKKASIRKNPSYSAPTPYDVLACLTKNDPGTFENFCADFGYDTDSRKAENTYNAVKEEYYNVARLYNEEELSQMAEIQ